MYRISALLFFLLVIHADVLSQILPKEGSVLNYRLIGFSFPAHAAPSADYKIEIARGSHTTADSFRNNIIATFPGKKNKIIAEVPSFGCSYTWRAVTAGERSKGSPGELHHFSTGTCAETDTAHMRLRVLSAATKYKDAFVFLDGNKVMYDMKGKPVWFLPGKKDYGPRVMDMKPTAAGTITFLSMDQAFEVNYDGTVLWKAPNMMDAGGEERGNYHHEFTRLSNGHYMVLLNEFLPSKKQTVADSSIHIIYDETADRYKNNPDFQSMPFGTIIEYDRDGKVVWKWRSVEYYLASDVVNYRSAKGVEFIDIHANAFFFDESGKALYISFKNISRIVKIRYPEGTVMNEYGALYSRSGVTAKEKGMFCNQHACKRSSLGCLFLFNNNGCEPPGLPKVKKFTEPATRSDQLKKIWEYTCTVESAQAPQKFMFGGNVVELPDQSLFVCMGSDYSKVFIVNPDKKVLWSALPEQWNPNAGKWDPVTQYRASIVYDRKQMEKLIWSTEYK